MLSASNQDKCPFFTMLRNNILLIGGPKSGKTSIFRALKGEDFVEEYAPTNIAQQGIYSYNTNNDYMNFNIFDVSGDPKHECIAREYFQGMSAIVIVVDSTIRNTFHSGKSWLDKIKKTAFGIMPYVFMVINKIDDSENVVVYPTEIEQWEKDNAIQTFQVSAKTKEGLSDFINTVCGILNETKWPTFPKLNNRKITENMGELEDVETTDSNSSNKKCCGCCNII